jgi:excinuclease ABC subunit A
MNPRHDHSSGLPPIRVRGARQNNLKEVDLDLPQNRLTVISGVSGSGKSSLALDTLYAEGQRRYIETFSPYTRQFLDRMDRPQANAIEHIPPAIAIDRKEPVRTSRSTVGTMTEITDFVKLLFVRRAELHCSGCGRPVRRERPLDVWRWLEARNGSEVVITFDYSIDPAEPRQEIAALVRLGFDRIYHQGCLQQIDAVNPDPPAGTLHVVADRVRFHSADRQRVMDSIEQAFRFGGSAMDLWIDGSHGRRFSRELACADCGIAYPAPVPNRFSFNSPLGACDTCRGFGRVIGMDLDLVIPDPSRTLEKGAIKPWGQPPRQRSEYDDLMRFCRRAATPIDVPFSQLTPRQQRVIIEGGDGFYGVRAFFKYLERKTYKMHVRVFLSRYRSYDLCPDCLGARFTPETLLYRLAGKTIAEIYALDVAAVGDFFDALSSQGLDIADAHVLDEVRGRLRYLNDVGLAYLTLDRQSRTLSGGEVQRVALASALGSSLVNTLYVLDEPSIGLHPRDTARLIAILKRLRDLSNTVVVVEHDPEIIAAADDLIEMGPGAGERGGQLVYHGPVAGIGDSITGDYLRGRRQVVPRRRNPRTGEGGQLVVRGADAHNLQYIDVTLPLQRLICLTGVSGSGKSTLAETILYRALKRHLGATEEQPGPYGAIEGIDHISAVDLVDQRAIGRTTRANLLTYCGALTPVRKILAATPAARELEMDAGWFSFNVDRGRCPACKGDGFEKVEMQFLSDIFITCPLCRGKRFADQVLSVRYRGRNIDDILAMTVSEALGFFEPHPEVTGHLQPLAAIGLGYIRLGQPLPTLSGGEAQRLKLSRHLVKKEGVGRLLILDEPTTGLHFHDVATLLAALQRLVAEGHSVLVIEHNLDVIRAADWVIDLGPEGGPRGGRVVATGTPRELAQHPASLTGKFLARTRTAGKILRPEPAVAEDNAAYTTSDRIQVTGAREHNLQNLNLAIPRHQLVALTGVSGSGKSTLAFDILFAEGQRRYLESLTPYARQFVRVMERPNVDHITGLPPAVAIEQRASHAGRRSTVATLTEIYHYLRLLFSKVGRPHCSGCGRPIQPMSAAAVRQAVEADLRQGKGRLLAPKIYARKGFHKQLLARLYRKGFRAARIDGRLRRLKPDMALSRYQDHTIEVVVADWDASASAQPLPESIESALKEGDGTLIVLLGDGREVTYSTRGTCPACGVGLPGDDPRRFSFNSPHGACPACEGLGEVPEGEEAMKPCDRCHGSRLRPEALSVTIDGATIWEICRLPASQAARRLARLILTGRDKVVAAPLVAEMQQRLSLLTALGLDYLPLSRGGHTLSGGEAQRVRLSAQLGSNLAGALYVLDEPTIGLHPTDTQRMLSALATLRDRGNTVLVVEHDDAVIRAADTIIDLGPGAGQNGGRIVAQGTLDTIQQAENSLTAQHLKQGRPHITSRRRPRSLSRVIRIEGACANNLRHLNVAFHLNTLTCVTGVSGSGKSSLVKHVLFSALTETLKTGAPGDGPWRKITGHHQVTRVLEVDHSPIGRTPRSVPASYIGILDEMRHLLARTPRARQRGYGPGRFSFNVAEGRCAACKGQGTPRIQMSFLPDVYVPCEACGGRRFNVDTLAVTYRGRSIADMLDMTFAEAARFFAAVPNIARATKLVCDIGLGYLRLGQPSPTLSGGEAQRIKLAKQLAKPLNGHTFYVLDEPTTGLHPADVTRLIDVLQVLVDAGNTLVIIEHNLDIIAAADHIIDLGPGGGDSGGHIVAQAPPHLILNRTTRSYTARCLKAWLESSALHRSGVEHFRN